MKYSFVAGILFFGLGLSFSIVRAEGFPDGADLFIEAIRYRGANHTLVYSLSYVTEQTYRVPTRSEEEIEKEAAEEEEAVRRDFKDDPNPPPWLDQIRETVRKRHTQGTLSRFTVKYKAPSFSRKLLSLKIERAGQGPTGWEEEINVLETNILSKDSASEGLQWFPQNRTAHVNDTQSYMETLLNFGRFQGPSVSPLLILLFQDTDVEKYEFSEQNIAKFKEELGRQLQLGEVKAAQTIGVVTYDGGAKAYIVESSKDGKVVERCWIDVARGYVCPLIQCYDGSGKLLSEYKAENYFLHEKSGLWFPSLYEEMTTDRDGKQQFKEYRIDKSSVNINFPIEDDEFAIEIPDGSTVIDERRGKGSKRHKAMDNGVLSLGKGGLDLENKKWLYPTELTPNPRRILFVRLFFGGVGTLLIILGLYFKFFARKP